MNLDMSILPKGSFHVGYGIPLEEPEKRVVMYHGPTCADGFGAAFAIHTTFKRIAEDHPVGIEILYIPMSYNTRFETLDALLPFLKDVLVSVVDFSFPVESVKAMVSAGAKAVEILDHHSGASGDIIAINQALENGEFEHPYVTAVFDNDQSGAVLAWEYYHEDFEPLPEVFKYIEDRDLWKWKYGDITKHVMAGIFAAPFEFSVWDSYLTERGLGAVLADGAAITRMRDKDIAAHAEPHNITFQALNGVMVAFVNAPWYVSSELANKLLEMHPQIDAADVWFNTASTIKHSFRSRKDGVNVAELLKPFGGGGHAAAAGVEFSYGDDNMSKFVKALNS